MNKVILIGRLTKNPEIKYSADNKAVARYTLAVDRRYKREGEETADFINCVAFGKTAEFVEKYFTKGSKMVAEGSIRTGSYTNKENQKVYTTDIIVDNVEFAESKSAKPADEQPADNSDGGFVAMPADDDELPFQ